MKECSSMMTDRQLKYPVAVPDRQGNSTTDIPFYIERLKKRLAEARTTDEIADIKLSTEPDVLVHTLYMFDEALDKVLCRIILTDNPDHDMLYEIFENAPRSGGSQKALMMASERLDRICLEKISRAKTFHDVYEIHLKCPPVHYCRKARQQIDRAIFKIGVARIDQLSAMELHLFSKFYGSDNYFSKKTKKVISSSVAIRERFYNELNQANDLDDYAKLFEQYGQCGRYFDDIINGRILEYCLAELEKDSSTNRVWELYLKSPQDRSARNYIVKNYLIKS